MPERAVHLPLDLEAEAHSLAGGAGGTGGVKNGEDGAKLIGGWGILNHRVKVTVVAVVDTTAVVLVVLILAISLKFGGGGSGYISPPYGSATLTTGNPGLDLQKEMLPCQVVHITQDLLDKVEQETQIVVLLLVLLLLEHILEDQ